MKESELKRQWLESMAQEAALEEKLEQQEATLAECRYERLQELYVTYNHGKLAEIDTLLEKYKGREEGLFRALRSKYLPRLVEAERKAAVSAEGSEKRPPSSVVSACFERHAAGDKDGKEASHTHTNDSSAASASVQTELEAARARCASLEAGVAAAKAETARATAERDSARSQRDAALAERDAALAKCGAPQDSGAPPKSETSADAREASGYRELATTVQLREALRRARADADEQRAACAAAQEELSKETAQRSTLASRLVEGEAEAARLRAEAARSSEESIAALGVEHAAALAAAAERHLEALARAEAAAEERSEAELRRRLRRHEEQRDAESKRALAELRAAGGSRGPALTPEVVALVESASKPVLRLLLGRTVAELGRTARLKELGETHIMLLEERATQRAELDQLQAELKRELEQLEPEFACRPRAATDGSYGRVDSLDASPKGPLEAREAALLAEWGGRRVGGRRRSRLGSRRKGERRGSRRFTRGPGSGPFR
jgi:hypothetical protein